MKLIPLDKDPCDYPKIYVQVYCALLVRSETSGFLPSISSTQDRTKADAIAKVAGIHTDAIVEYLMTNIFRETQSAKS
ncbi:hypothetical protein IQ238_01250 [Pleurocapsales cyanobacterium LEGE 06147]|nr:hypothetical protein [Pleurocapsales cyanobacterium LEGE 06147]